ncbi:hypothetical protein [Streptomyces sp. NPDC057702]|uniref:hypothetical protein n=1 Tax=unclassified Streptomyces TaxID=2593676 RepID=UPI0036CCED1C
MSDGMAWIAEELGPDGFQLVALRGADPEELAVMLGAEPGTVMAAPAFNSLVRAAGSTVRLPDLARLGGHADWAFAFETGGGYFRTNRSHLNHLWEGRTYVRVSDTSVDPPTISVVVDGVWDWSYFDGEVHEQARFDHPLTARMTAEIGLGDAVPDPDFPDDPDECALFVPAESDVYRLFGEHYGLSLPRHTVRRPHHTDTDLSGAFTAPRVLPDGRPNPAYAPLRQP